MIIYFHRALRQIYLLSALIILISRPSWAEFRLGANASFSGISLIAVDQASPSENIRLVSHSVLGAEVGLSYLSKKGWLIGLHGRGRAIQYAVPATITVQNSNSLLYSAGLSVGKSLTRLIQFSVDGSYFRTPLLVPVSGLTHSLSPFTYYGLGASLNWSPISFGPAGFQFVSSVGASGGITLTGSSGFNPTNFYWSAHASAGIQFYDIHIGSTLFYSQNQFSAAALNQSTTELGASIGISVKITGGPGERRHTSASAVTSVSEPFYYYPKFYQLP